MTIRTVVVAGLLGVTGLSAACAGVAGAPSDRPSVDGCVEWFNQHRPVGDADVVDVVAAAQSADEWNGQVPVCWVTLFQPECAIHHAMGPDWEWRAEPLPPGDCNPARLSVNVRHRLDDGRLMSR